MRLALLGPSGGGRLGVPTVVHRVLSLVCLQAILVATPSPGEHKRKFQTSPSLTKAPGPTVWLINSRAAAHGEIYINTQAETSSALY